MYRNASMFNTSNCLYFLKHLLINYFFSFVYSGSILSSARPIISSCGGLAHMCFVFDNKMMKCLGLASSWGLFGSKIGDEIGELGDNLPYVSISSSALILKVTCGNEHICTRLESNEAKCLGSNTFGQIGIGSDSSFVGLPSGHVGDLLPSINIGDGLAIKDIYSGQYHVCALTFTDKIKCFGHGLYGQLGYGNTNNLGKLSSDMGNLLEFVDLGLNVLVSSIHIGSSSAHNCAVLKHPPDIEQRIKCWGYNEYFQLGYGVSEVGRGTSSTHMGDNLPLVDLGTESRVKQMSLGKEFTCGMLINDVLKCWGRGGVGQLNSGSVDSISATGNSMPSFPTDLGKLVRIFHTGRDNTCVVYEDLITIKCVGANRSGQIGLGNITFAGFDPSSTIDKLPAIDLNTGNLAIATVSGGYRTTCVIFIDYSVKCFGENSYGQLGIGSDTNIGDNPGEMGVNLTFTKLFSPTPRPTTSPTISPTRTPTVSPTSKSPTSLPTTNPTNIPTISPTNSPTNVLIPYVPKKADCYMIPTKSACESELNSECGSCVYYSSKARYRFRARVDFIMAKGLKFIDLDNYNANPPKTALVDSVKLLLSSKLDGEERILIYRLGQIFQATGSDSGYADFEVNFVDNESNKIAARKYLESNPTLHEYTDELNYQLNRRLKTTGIQYIKGSIFINQLTITDLDNGKGTCGCIQDIKSNARKIKSTLWLLPTLLQFLLFNAFFNYEFFFN